jgi:hypothetical protein
MFMKYYLSILIGLCIVNNAAMSQINQPKIFHITSAHTSFPDTGRANGHLYDSVLYDAITHYSDSSVLIITPSQFSAGKNIDMVFWFHGWRNNIDSANVRYALGKQFFASHRNAVLVLAETAKDAPDSYGGKLEQRGEFDLLLNDVMNELKQQKIISNKAAVGNVTLAGHSGAYRVIAYILQNSGQKVHTVFLFDALYAETDKFMNWIKLDPKNIFINWYTNQGGGTDEVSKDMMEELQKEAIPFVLTEEDSLTMHQLKRNRIIFVHSLREHNDIINDPDNFKLLLQATDDKNK